ncbi:hypothetical protein [Nostoc sp. UHCC 0870]|uniref:hypothetical protein n=1 Tax=Nostoc sp. UHCC 0870 TaxID=2914041 RepID=UPI001EE012C1|nr:hypothetical protein [Nostoc sp. UHCC 0870]UKO97454.1 hypothetical protein L6494_23225 [Nostoc sp. UHCC 0870]
MIISDINYLEAANEEIFGGRGININSRFVLNKTVIANVNIREVFNKQVTLNVSGLIGNGAEVLGSADAQGNNTFTSIIFGTQTEENSSESFINASSFTR